MDEGLERALADGDAEAFLVYADQLITEGDPRGELIQVQHRLESHPKDKELRAAERALIKQHTKHLLGPLARVAKRQLSWRLGFLDSLTLRLPGLETIDELMSHPCSRFVRDLDVVTGHRATPALVLRLARYRRPSLRSLGIVQRTPWIDDYLVDGPAYSVEDGHEHAAGDALWVTYPKLERLAVIGHRLFHEIAAPNLTELRLGDCLPACALRLPRLERLTWELAFSELADDQLAPLFAGELPALRTLDFSGEVMHGVEEEVPVRDLGTLRTQPAFRALGARIKTLVLPRDELIRDDLAAWFAGA